MGYDCEDYISDSVDVSFWTFGAVWGEEFLLLYPRMALLHRDFARRETVRFRYQSETYWDGTQIPSCCFHWCACGWVGIFRRILRGDAGG